VNERGEEIEPVGSTDNPADIVRFALAYLRPVAFISLTRVWERTNITKIDLAPAEDFRW
jgi:hypothetical protein